MAGLTERLDGARVRDNLARIREEIARDDVEVLAAVKYVPLAALGVLVEAGVTLVGENRAQELERKSRAFPGLTWDFIGHVQSRKVKQILPHVRLIHSVASDSVLRQLARHATPATEVLVEVNVAREPGKSGIDPAELDAFLERCPCRVGGLMTMPPETSDPEGSRPWFAELARLAGERGLRRLSMGTSQDYVVAAQEGATIVRIGTKLYG
ncbi:MAG TPA: YggS family pyridoxal phosphate enzyme [Solirubrobacteraceae bacterium]|nr:YggS family pyridoxal phosphate enzyme [Solirubrobacteraceae bacterium]